MKYYGWSPYVYSRNNPIGFLDPSGLATYVDGDNNVIFDDKNEDTKEQRFYVPIEVLDAATDKEGNTDWASIANPTNQLYGDEKWSDIKDENRAAKWNIDGQEYLNVAGSSDVVTQKEKQSDGLIDNSMSLTATVMGSKIALNTAITVFENDNNWVRIGMSKDKGQDVYRIALGAHPKYLKQMPEGILKELNKLIRTHIDLCRK